MRYFELFENNLIRYGENDYDSVIKHGRPVSSKPNFEEGGNIFDPDVLETKYDFERLISLTNRPMYHGSCYDFEKFDTPRERYRGIHFTSSKESAEGYAKFRVQKLEGSPYLYRAKLNYKNPLLTGITNDYRAALMYARKNGFDAVIGPMTGTQQFTDINVTVLSAKQIVIVSKTPL